MTEIPNHKPVLVIEYWNLRFVCNLVLGAWDFITPLLHCSSSLLPTVCCLETTSYGRLLFMSTGLSSLSCAPLSPTSVTTPAYL